ncbi:MAG: phosphoglycerate dehydrogenase [Kiritimatiellae bacterium]|nr:phosphoglycerate dehydrogenase [Kiritimatiellia bacterium]MDO4749354.1 phosphoglycerate dehydrogenase [Eubacteriales bacterium]
MHKVKTINKIAEAGLDYLAKVGCEVSEDFEQPEALLIRSVKLHDTKFNPELLCIARAGAGVNNVPVKRCLEEGICVFNTPGANAEAVKELAICALLMSSRDVIGGIQWAHSIADQGDAIPNLVEKGKEAFTGPELAGKTLGVLGLGAVGARIANAAIGLGMKVYGYDPYLSVDAAWMLSRHVMHATDVDTLYQNCDYITIHVPYMESTHHMINAAALAKMKDGVRIMNLARAELVDDDALIEALDAGKVACYVTDFPNAKTVNVPHIIPMPHLGASTPESEEKCALMGARQIYDYLENGNITNSVNFPNAAMPRTGACRICVFHSNVPRMLNACLEIVGSENINVENLINKARGDYAYTMMDLSTVPSAAVEEKLAALEGVMRVRVLL